MSGMKHQNSVKINKLTFLSVANVPVRFRAQQRPKYSSPSLTATRIAGKRSPTLFQTDFRITNHGGNKFPPSITPAPFIQNSNRMASRLIATASFPSVLGQLLQFSRQRPSFSAHRAAVMTKTDLTCPVFSLRFVDFAVQFCFCCKFSLHKKRPSSQA